MTHSQDIEASGFLEEPMGHLHSEFTEITEIHRSERNIVLKAKRYGRWWVLKCAAQGAGEVAALAALRKEFEVSVMLPRDCVANVYGMEEVEGYGQCVVMDYVDGPRLRKWLASDPTRRQREAMALRIVDIVGKVHQCGIVHRDIKPENILVNSIGEYPVLIDFGLADTAHHSDFKEPAGTRRYMSPEQAYAATPDIRNDIYSLGCVLGEMELPGIWKRVVRRCLLPIEKRVPDTAGLLRLLRRGRRLRRVLRIVIPGILLIGAAVFAVQKLSESPGRVAVRYVSDEEQRLRADSLARSMDSLRMASGERIAALTGSLDSINNAKLQAEQQEREHKAELERVINDEKKVLRKLWHESEINYDKAVADGTVASFNPLEVIEEERARFLKSMEDHYTREEIVSANMEVSEDIGKYVQVWLGRFQEP